MRVSIAILLLVICHSLHAAILETNGSYKNCRCTKQSSDFIHPKRYESIEIIPPGGGCRNTEMIVKLKTGYRLCVNPQAPWMKKVLNNIQKPSTTVYVKGPFPPLLG